MSKTKVLIVEDNAIVSLDIKKTIENYNYEVSDIATNYDEAMKKMRLNNADVAFIDIKLPGLHDGIKVAEDVTKKYKIPIIYLSSFSDDNTLKRALQVDPVSYIVKPFKREDIKAALQIAENKIKNKLDNSKSKHIGDNYYFEIENGRLYHKNEPIKLSIAEKKLLSILIQAKGSIVTFDKLENLLWPNKKVSESSLRTLIYRLRNKIDSNMIETIPTFGCKIN